MGKEGSNRGWLETQRKGAAKREVCVCDLGWGRSKVGPTPPLSFSLSFPHYPAAATQRHSNSSRLCSSFSHPPPLTGNILLGPQLLTHCVSVMFIYIYIYVHIVLTPLVELSLKDQCQGQYRDLRLLHFVVAGIGRCIT